MTQVGEGEVNAFDIVRTFKAESTTEEPLSGTYYLKAYYFAGEGYSGFCDGIALNADNGYEATIKTADYKFLVPETEYQLQFTIEANQYNTSIDDSYCVVYETVKTTKANLVLENTVNLFNRQTYTVALSEDDVRNFTGTQSLGVYTYLKKADATNYRDMDKYAYLTKYNNYSSTIMFFNG